MLEFNYILWMNLIAIYRGETLLYGSRTQPVYSLSHGPVTGSRDTLQVVLEDGSFERLGLLVLVPPPT